jgi:hypothetical protein
LGFLGGIVTAASAPLSPLSSGSEGSVPKAPGALYGSLPLTFEPNEGQTDPRVRFLAHGQGYSLFLTSDEMVLALRAGLDASQSQGHEGAARGGTVLGMKLLGVRQGRVEGMEELAGKSNYFIGNDPKKWRTDVPNYAQVKYSGVYPGVDLVYYGRHGQLEYDFVVKPEGSPGEVRFRVEGGDRVRVNEAGELVIQTGAGEVELRRPEAYQGEGGGRRRVAVSYVRRGDGEIGLKVGAYRRDRALTIDPVLVYSTYLGGSGGDIAYGIRVDSSDNAYVTGITGSVNFPVKSADQPSLAGESNAFVSKLNASGSGLIYSTYIGGTGSDAAAGIAIDASGNAYIVGNTSSVDFPVTPGAFQPTYGGATDAFVTKLNALGSSLTYSSYLGGSAADFGQGIAVDSSGNAFVTGSTESFDLPTLNPLQPGNDGCTTIDMVETCSSDAFVAEVNTGGSALVYSTYLGGSGTDSGQAIAVDGAGDAYITGYTGSSDFPTQNALQSQSGGGNDAFVTEFNPSGSQLVFSTYLGGNGNDQAFGLVLDTSGNIYVTGGTQSTNFPTTPNVFQTAYGGNGDAFLTKMGMGGTLLVYSTFIGGSGLDQGNGVAVDSLGNAVVVGSTQSSDFPSVDPSQRVLGISGAGSCGSAAGTAEVCSDAFVTRLNPSGMPEYSTYLGGTEADFAQAVAVDSTGAPYVAGSTASSNFPAIVGALQGAYAGVGSSGNAFVAKVDASDLPGIALSPQALNFGNQTLGVASTAQSITLINAGSAPLQITSIAGTPEYAVSNNCGTTVPAGSGSCTINVTFTPTTAGANTNELIITDNAAGSPHYVAVTGSGVTGGAGTLTPTPKSVVFPIQALNTTSPAQVVQLVNASLAAITISDITVTGDFAETNNCGTEPAVLNAGASCSVSVTFTPTASGSRTGSLSITDNAAGSPQGVGLSGAGGGVFTVSANSRSSSILVGTDSTTFTISASAASSFTSSITFGCSSGVTCSFNPTSIMAGQSTVMSVTGLSATTSNPLNLTVTGTSGSNTATVTLAIFLQDFTVAATPNLNDIDAGQNATYIATVTPVNGFNAVVLFSCSSTLPASSCTWSPSSGLVLNGLSPNSATLTVTTTSQQSTHGWPRRLPPGGPGSRGLWVVAAGLIAMCGALLASVKRRPHALLRRARFMLVVAGIVLLAAGALSCQTYGYNVIAPPIQVGTPTGTYTITISGTLGSNSNVVRSTTVNLTVGPG